MTKSNEQPQFVLLYIPHNLFEGNTYKYILTGIDVASRRKVAGAVKTRKSSEVAFVLESIYRKGGVFKYPKVFKFDKGQSLKVKSQRCLKHTMLIFEERQRNTSIPIQPLWKPLTKSFQNCCLSP